MLKGIKGYIAGIIDGEGCIYMRKTIEKNQKNFHYTIALTVNNTNYDVIKFLKEKCKGGYIQIHKSVNPCHKTQWKWEIKNQMASNLLEMIYPFLIIKKKQANLVIKFQKHKRKYFKKLLFHFGYSKIRSISSKELKYRDKIQNKLKQLNA